MIKPTLIRHRPADQPKVVVYAVAVLFLALLVRATNVVMVGLTLSMSATIFGLIIAALPALLLVPIHKGRNWARITYLVYFLWSLTRMDWFVLLDLPNTYGSLTTFEFLNLTMFALQIWTMYALFTFPGSDWFLKPEKPQEDAAHGSSTASQ